MREPSIGDTMTQEQLDAAPSGTIIRAAKGAALWAIKKGEEWILSLPLDPFLAWGDDGRVLVQWGWGNGKPRERQHHRRKYP